ncbi:sigma-70 family RNA polymerase sigma factor [Pirellulaceae bacterium SH449]
MKIPITEYLEAVRSGEPGANQALLELVYDSLRRIAVSRMGREFRREEFQPTELVHEAWIRLGANEVTGWENRFHFFSAAAEAMRRTLIDNARRRQSRKRGGRNAKRQKLSDDDLVVLPLADELLDLDEALSALEVSYPIHVRVVKLKFFAGLTMNEIAEVTNVSVATVERYWAFSRAWLQQRMSGEQSDQGLRD